MQKVTIYRVDSVSGGRSAFMPKLSEARLFSATHPELVFDEVTGKVEIVTKPQLCRMLCRDEFERQQVGSFLKMMGHEVEGRYE